MKVLLLVATVALVAVNADLLAYLKEIQGHYSFQHLPTQDKVLFSELVMAAETNTLEAFIDRIGLVNVLELMDRMSSGDAAKFSAYLAEHLGYHHHASGSDSILTKRDHDDDDDFHGFFTINHNQYHFNLPDQEKATWDALHAAAKTNTVTAYIDAHGYAAVFGLLEYLDPIHSNELLKLLEAQLQKEAGLTVAKRDHDHDDRFNGWFDNNQHNSVSLQDQEKATWDALHAAAKTNTLTAYIDANGYGAVFGLLEHLDRRHADELLNLMEYQLKKEAAAAAAAP